MTILNIRHRRKKRRYAQHLEADGNQGGRGEGEGEGEGEFKFILPNGGCSGCDVLRPVDCWVALRGRVFTAIKNHERRNSNPKKIPEKSWQKLEILQKTRQMTEFCIKTSSLVRKVTYTVALRRRAHDSYENSRNIVKAKRIPMLLL